MNEHLTLLGRFIRSPRTIGAVAPSSRTLARAMVASLDLSQPVCVVELGPGTGVFTREIAARLGPEARALAIDVDPGFVDALRRTCSRVEAVCGSAADLPALVAAAGCGRVDHIISGLPFATLPGPVTSSILEGISQVLPVGGTMTTFQYVHGFHTPLAAAFRASLSAHLGGPPSRRLVMRNLPPMCWNGAGHESDQTPQ
ncbi:MAG: methyltransferase domain-containing protein [Acidobacteria bacterium]|nr:methyltransferase domain-containing protein [Acidobacteriota bacterium]